MRGGDARVSWCRGIAVFVLRCRVFGCDVETALLNDVKRRGGFPGRCKQIVGQYLRRPLKSHALIPTRCMALLRRDDARVYSDESAIEDPTG